MQRAQAGMSSDSAFYKGKAGQTQPVGATHVGAEGESVQGEAEQGHQAPRLRGPRGFLGWGGARVSDREGGGHAGVRRTPWARHGWGSPRGACAGVCAAATPQDRAAGSPEFQSRVLWQVP